MSPTTSPSVYVPGKVRTVQSPYYDTLVVASGSSVNAGGVTKMFGNVQGVGESAPTSRTCNKRSSSPEANRFCSPLSAWRPLDARWRT